MRNPILVALQGKGMQKFVDRVRSLSSRYGLTASKMDRALAHFGRILSEYDSGATFPITAAALARSPGVIEKYQAQNMEFAVHGFYHVDHSQLSRQQQVLELSKARRLFDERGVKSAGFRSPYLRYRDETLEAINESGFMYDSSHSLVWNVVNGQTTDSYLRVLEFYGARDAKKYPALPHIEKGIIEIPYCLPDDEALIERLPFSDDQARSQPWLDILDETHRLGELFTLGLHPERIFLCEIPLRNALQKARSLSPRVWIARLDEIANWWTRRAELKAKVISNGADEYRLEADQIEGLTVLSRNVEMLSPNRGWDGRYVQAIGNEIRFRFETKPVIGLSPSSDPMLRAFLHQQGYIVENAEGAEDFSLHLHRPQFSREDERPLLDEIEDSDSALVKFGRWPDGAKSALSVTGDIDALTIWDYGLRILGK
ncbi:MAG: polysaccharide deacetylase family protein, partial [Anaerolineales bacterium]